MCCSHFRRPLLDGRRHHGRQLLRHGPRPPRQVLHQDEEKEPTKPELLPEQVGQQVQASWG